MSVSVFTAIFFLNCRHNSFYFTVSCITGLVQARALKSAAYHAAAVTTTPTRCRRRKTDEAITGSGTASIAV